MHLKITWGGLTLHIAWPALAIEGLKNVPVEGIHMVVERSLKAEYN
jgi:hypothetical protein